MRLYVLLGNYNSLIRVPTENICDKIISIAKRIGILYMHGSPRSTEKSRITKVENVCVQKLSQKIG